MAPPRRRAVGKRPGAEPDDSTVVKYLNTQAIAGAFNHLVRWGGFVVIAYFATRCVEAIAGQRTVADIGLAVQFFGDVTINQLSAWTFGMAGVWYGVAQNRFRKRTIERLTDRIGELEKGIDSKRTSSTITKRGETRPEDRG